MTDTHVKVASDETEFDVEFLTAECLLKIATEAFMQKHGVDRDVAKNWLRLAGEVVLEGPERV